MKKIIILALSVITLAFIVAGCGGGGGGGSTPGQITTYFHFVNSNNNTTITGLALVYTDPNGTSYTTDYSDDNGDILRYITIAGIYKITAVKYNITGLGTGTISVSEDIKVDQADINRNQKVRYTIPIDVNTTTPENSSIGNIVKTEL